MDLSLLQKTDTTFCPTPASRPLPRKAPVCGKIRPLPCKRHKITALYLVPISNDCLQTNLTKWTNPGLFLLLFVFSIWHKSNFKFYKSLDGFAWNSNLGCHDGRWRRNHWAMAAPHYKQIYVGIYRDTPIKVPCLKAVNVIKAFFGGNRKNLDFHLSWNSRNKQWTVLVHTLAQNNIVVKVLFRFRRQNILFNNFLILWKSRFPSKNVL